MKVKELISELQQYDGEMEVLVSDLTNQQMKTIKMNMNEYYFSKVKEIYEGYWMGRYVYDLMNRPVNSKKIICLLP